MSNIIEEFREIQKNVSDSRLNKQYYKYIENILDAKKRKDFDEMLKYCQLSWSLLEGFIRHQKKMFKSFDLSSAYSGSK